ncbi:alpha/beta fold hydrolase [Kitasatospora acidiphila]|uniref:Alpha/beta fold hydrolase n=1 Tax=Kitasatospora acidiphila TaxID=2567942 RepID=A0A540VYU4_9ACTN|nr:alpha/beta fold hydrolase [Kitasatospora acidiphila]TQF01913.1 alpha/beta fold hydrolase [Kitasatospora acidiphila]
MTQLEELGSRLSPQRRALLGELARRRAAPVRIPRRDGGGPLRASFAQARLWLVDQLEQGASAYQVPLPVRLRGVLDIDALAGSLTDLIGRHEALRTAFREDDADGLLQVVRPPQPITLPVTDLAGLSEPQQQAAVREHLAEDQAAPFDLAEGRLLRARLLRLAPDHHVLLAGAHHIGFDGWSVPLFHRELAAGYNARVRGELPRLPAPELQYADYSAWQRRQLTGARLDRLLDYWSERLAGAVELELPTDRPVQEVRSTRGGTARVAIPRELMADLAELARSQGASLFMAMAAALGVMFSRHTGGQDICFGTTYADRDRSELHSVIGFFTNTFVLRTDLSGKPGFRELLQRTRERAVGDYTHAGLPFDLLVDHLQPRRVGNRTPFFRVHFQVEEAAGTLSAYEELPAYQGLSAEGLVPEFVAAKFDLSFTLRSAADGGLVDLVYSADLFDAATADRLVAQLRTVLAALVAEPDRGIAELPIPELPRPAAPQPAPSGGTGAQQQAVSEELTAQVRQAWQSALGLEDFGPHEDFFDLGGNSFAAIKVRRLLGGRVPMVDLFRFRTVHQLAAHLGGLSDRTAEPAGLWSELTTPGPSAEVSLICVPYAGGNAAAYQPLAERLPSRIALWAANLPGHEGGGAAADLLPLPEATQRLADELQERVSGPVVVYGHCAGASQAIDLARELEDRGVPVRAVFIGASLTDPEAAANLSRATDSPDDELHGYIKAIGGFDGALDEADLRQVLRVLRHDMVDATRFQRDTHAAPPRRLRAPVHCVLGDADPATPEFGTRYLGWQVFAESVSLDVLPGAGHYFLRDRAAELAAIIESRTGLADDRIPVLCLPHTGAGASFFHPWLEAAGDRFLPVPLELPGREKRIAEEPCRTVAAAVDDLLPQALRAAGAAKRVVVFGHCLGGVLAYELAHRLVTSTDIEVARILVSGAPGPLVPRVRKATGLPDDEFLARLEELAGYRHPALDDPDMVELLLPVLRADQEMYEGYCRTEPAPLDVPITTLRGAQDALVSAAEVAQWQAATAAPLDSREFPGGHMYLTDRAGEVLDLISRELS